MSDQSLQMLPSAKFGDIVLQDLLPTLKNVLLRAVGIQPFFFGLEITDRAGGNEKPRVVRTTENSLLSHLVTILLELLKLRFESLLVSDSFITIWSQVRS